MQAFSHWTPPARHWIGQPFGILDPSRGVIPVPSPTLAMPGAPSAPQLGRLGVARVSVGPGVTQVALAAAQRAARELLEEGTYTAFEAGLPFAELNALFAQRSTAMLE